MSETIEAHGGSFTVELQASRTDDWCACGRSASQPLRDGGHQRP